MLNDDANAVADDPHAPLLESENREGVIARRKSVPKLYVLRILVIYGIFEFHYNLLKFALYILPFINSPHVPEIRYIPPSLPPWLYIIAVTLTAGVWLRLATPSALGPKRVMMISIAGMFIFAIAVLIYLQYFLTSYTAACIVHLLNGLLGGNLVFGALIYAQLADVITRPLSRFAIFSFVMGLDFILHYLANMVVFTLFGFMLNEGTIEVPAWIVCLLIPVVHLVLVRVLLPDNQAGPHVDYPWKRLDKVVATPLAVLLVPKRILLISSAFVTYTIVQSFSMVKLMLILAHRHDEGRPFPYLFYTISPLATLVLLLVVLPGGIFVYMHRTTRKPTLTAQYRFIRLFATWGVLFDIVTFILVPILVYTTSSETIPLVVAGLSLLTDSVVPALYALLSVVPTAPLFGGLKILDIIARQVSLEVTIRKMPFQEIGKKDERKMLVICGVLVIVLAIAACLVNYAGDVDETVTRKSGPDVEDEETSALAPPEAVEEST